MEKRKIILIIITSLITFSSFSQNLVLNHSFENYKKLNYLGEHVVDTMIYDWHTVINRFGSNNCFNVNFSNIDFQIPNNVIGQQNICDSNAYAGIYVYVSTTTLFNASTREYITGELNSTLINGRCYKVSFKYSLGDNVSQVAISNFGFYFSDSIPINNSTIWSNANLNYTPQLEVNQILNDKQKWVKIERFYTASGNENYFTMGNFNENINTNTFFVKNGFNSQGGKSSYVYLDDIHIEEVPTISLPQINLGADTILCKGETISFDSLLPNNPVYVWNNLVESSDSSFTIDSSGTYWVEAYNGCSYTTDTINIMYQDINVNLKSDTSLCNQETYLIQKNIPNAQYLWNDSTTNNFILINDSGSYWLQATVGRCSNSDTILVDYTRVDADLGNDTTLCEGQEISLSKNIANAKYLWSNADTSNAYLSTTEEEIWLKIFLNNCENSDTIRISRIPQIEEINLKDTLFCGVESGILNAQTEYQFNSYLWSTGEDSPLIVIKNSDFYTVEISNQCFSEIFESNVIFEGLEEGYSPINIFTPNGDNLNEVFLVYNVESEEYKLEIYNRWGKLIWKTEEPGNYWTGEGINDGTYFYHLSFINCTNETIEKKGFIEIKR